MMPEQSTSPVWLDPDDPLLDFPDPESVKGEPEGLVAIGGDLSPERLVKAYNQGFFPWFEDGQPILWWNPDPRAILPVDGIKVSRSLKKTLKRQEFNITFDQAFSDVVSACAAPRSYSEDTWITKQMKDAYLCLHTRGIAHSVEIRDHNEVLIAGLYGILTDRVFSGESMFHKKTDMSKVALIALAEWLKARNIHTIDCQIINPHLTSLGAIEIPRKTYRTDYLKCS